MKKRRKEAESSEDADDLRPEYRFNYGRSRPNRFAGRISEKSTVVVLDPDVASVFKDSDSVNDLLRSVAKALMPGKLQGDKKRGRRK